MYEFLVLACIGITIKPIGGTTMAKLGVDGNGKFLAFGGTTNVEALVHIWTRNNIRVVKLLSSDWRQYY